MSKASIEQLFALEKRLADEIESIRQELFDYSITLVETCKNESVFKSIKDIQFFLDLADRAIIHQLQKSINSRKFFQNEIRTLFPYKEGK